MTGADSDVIVYTRYTRLCGKGALSLDIVLSTAGGKPLYAQIAGQIEDQILAGTLAPGEPLPSMRALARMLHISVITTKRAYADLERGGFLVTVAGKGCFVARKSPGLLRGERQRRALGALRGAVRTAKRAGLPLEELEKALAEIYNEES